MFPIKNGKAVPYGLKLPVLLWERAEAALPSRPLRSFWGPSPTGGLALPRDALRRFFSTDCIECSKTRYI